MFKLSVFEKIAKSCFALEIAKTDFNFTSPRYRVAKVKNGQKKTILPKSVSLRPFFYPPSGGGHIYIYIKKRGPNPDIVGCLDIFENKK